MRRKRLRRFICMAAIPAFCGCLALALLCFGVIHLNHPGKNRYPVRGVDVSSYQGEIDWQSLAAQNIEFAFIKATEGSDYVDECFSKNLSAALETDLKVGAYHFFTVLSSGKAQAENFIRTVPKTEDMLPPVVDVELTAANTPLGVEEIRLELRDLLDAVTAYYGKKPIVYTTKESYAELISGVFDTYDVWYRSVYGPAPETVHWTFWQYSNRHRLKGYSGKERFIDMNVFCGGREAWKAYCAGA